MTEQLPGSPGDLIRAAATLSRAAGDLAAHDRLVRHTATQVTGGWLGAAAMMFTDAARRRSERVGAADRALSALGHDIRRYAVALEEAQCEAALLARRRAALVEDLHRAQAQGPGTAHLVPALRAQILTVERATGDVHRRVAIARQHFSAFLDRSEPRRPSASRSPSVRAQPAEIRPRPCSLVQPVWAVGRPRFAGGRMRTGPVAPVDGPGGYDGRMHCGPVSQVIGDPGRMRTGPVAPW